MMRWLCGWIAALCASSCLGGLSFERGAGAFCDLDSPCIAGLYCRLEANECLPELALASSCDRDLACATKACVDGVCCEELCEGACSLCNLPESAGHCADAPEGTDPLDACPGTTSCGPGGVCQASPLWSAFYGGLDVQTTRDVATGPIGDVVVVGSFLGFLDFGSGTPSNNSGLEDGFIAKYDNDGALQWATIVSGDARQVVESVRLDGAGNVFVVGWFDDNMMLDGMSFTSSDGDADGFVAKLDSGGNLQWARPLAGDGQQRLSAMVLDDDSDQIHVAGIAGDDFALDACSIMNAPLTGAVTLARLDKNGACDAMIYLGGSGAKSRIELALGGDGAILVGVTGRGGLDLGNGILAGSPIDDDIWLGKLSTALDGAIWSQHHGGIGNDALSDIAVTSRNDVWLVGSFSDVLDLSGGQADLALTSAADRDGFIAKLNAFGAHISSDSFGGLYDQEMIAADVTAQDELIVGGRFQLSLDFGDGPLVASGGFDAFLAKLDADGIAVWSLPLGGAMDETLAGIAVDFAGSIAFAGDYESDLVIEPDDDSPAGGASDGFVAKLTP